MYMKYRMYIFFLIYLLLIITPVFSQSRGVDIKPIGRDPLKPSPVQQASNWIVEHIWLVVIFLAIGGGLFIFLYIWRKTVSKIDPFFENWKKTKELCKLNKRWNIKDVYRVSGNTGLKWLGKYEGDCITEDKSINIMWSNWKWGLVGKIIRWVFFPLRPLLKLVMKEFSICKAPYGERVIEKFNEKTIKEGDKDVKIPVPVYGKKIYEYIVFDDSGNCLIKAVSLSKSKNYFCPVVLSEKGEVIDTRKTVFYKESGEALVGTLYNLTMDFANIMRERISIEPKVRYVQKTEGTEVRDEG
jgi:hypothetical protein